MPCKVYRDMFRAVRVCVKKRIKSFQMLRTVELQLIVLGRFGCLVKHGIHRTSDHKRRAALDFERWSLERILLERQCCDLKSHYLDVGVATENIPISQYSVCLACEQAN